MSGIRRSLRAWKRAFLSWEGVLAVVLLVALGGGGAVGLGIVGPEDVEGTPAEGVVSGIDDAIEAEQERRSLNQSQAERLIHQETNEVRESHGLQPLQYHDGVATDARGHSRDMAARDYFSHDTPEGDGIRSRYPGACRAVGENIAQTYWRERIQGEGGDGQLTSGSGLAESVVEQWMNSPGHRENLLSPRWASEGIGIAMDDDKVYVTQGFCN